MDGETAAKPKAAIWARVSTAKETQSDALEHQLARLRAEAARRGYDVARVYQHRGLSTYRTAAGLDEAIDGVIADAAADGVGVLLVTRVDRLSRGGVLHTLAAVKRLTDAGVRLEVWTTSCFRRRTTPLKRRCFASFFCPSWRRWLDSSQRNSLSAFG